MKQKRYLRTLACLILGALLLSGSALANYDNASGYTKLKNGMLNMMTVENFSVDANYSLKFNGTELDSMQTEYKYDRNGSTSAYTKTLDSYGSSEMWTQDGFNISHYNDTYSVHTAPSKGFNDSYLSGTGEDKNTTDKVVNFAELLCDTLVGDLKNNFVLVSAENGVSTYQIDLSKEQIPELIQSGLSVLFGTSSNSGYVTFDCDITNMTDAELEALSDEAYGVLAEHNYVGVVCVMEDGTIEYYASESEYYHAAGTVDVDATSLNSLYSLFADDPSISGVSCTVTLDSEGRLSYIKASGTLTGKDEDGKELNATLDLELSFYDYGTTSIEAFDKSLLNFNWENADDDYYYYQFDSEGNIIEYDSYQYNEGGNTIVYGDEIVAEDPVPADADESAAVEVTESAEQDLDGGSVE